MTIQELKNQCDKTEKRFFDFVSQATEIWKNNACLGYIIKAMEDMCFSRDDIRRVVSELHGVFDEMSTDEADSYYCNSKY